MYVVCMWSLLFTSIIIYIFASRAFNPRQRAINCCKDSKITALPNECCNIPFTVGQLPWLPVKRSNYLSVLWHRLALGKGHYSNPRHLDHLFRFHRHQIFDTWDIRFYQSKKFKLKKIYLKLFWLNLTSQIYIFFKIYVTPCHFLS